MLAKTPGCCFPPTCVYVCAFAQQNDVQVCFCEVSLLCVCVVRMCMRAKTCVFVPVHMVYDLFVCARMECMHGSLGVPGHAGALFLHRGWKQEEEFRMD